MNLLCCRNLISHVWGCKSMFGLHLTVLLGSNSSHFASHVYNNKISQSWNFIVMNMIQIIICVSNKNFCNKSHSFKYSRYFQYQHLFYHRQLVDTMCLTELTWRVMECSFHSHVELELPPHGSLMEHLFNKYNVALTSRNCITYISKWRPNVVFSI